MNNRQWTGLFIMLLGLIGLKNSQTNGFYISAIVISIIGCALWLIPQSYLKRFYDWITE